MRVYSSYWKNAIGFSGIFSVICLNVNAFVVPFVGQQRGGNEYCATAALSSSSNGFYFAAGEARVDMNVYNVGLEKAAEEWKAVVQAKTSMQDEGIFLNIHNSNKDLFVDTLTFTIDRSSQGGLGIGLLELAGGREDGLGITIVDELIDGGNAAQQTDIQPGDSIVQLSTSSTTTTGREEDKTVSRISTECLGYDATVDAILSLPEEANMIQITVKRIRRQPKINVKLQYPPSQQEEDVLLELFAGENLRRAMLARGVKLNDALAERFDSGGLGDCGAEGTCATCIVNIPNDESNNLLNPQKTQEKQILAKFPTRRLACKTVVGYGMTEGDLTVQVNPRQW